MGNGRSEIDDGTIARLAHCPSPCPCHPIAHRPLDARDYRMPGCGGHPQSPCSCCGARPTGWHSNRRADALSRKPLPRARGCSRSQLCWNVTISKARVPSSKPRSRSNPGQLRRITCSASCSTGRTSSRRPCLATRRRCVSTRPWQRRTIVSASHTAGSAVHPTRSRHSSVRFSWRPTCSTRNTTSARRAGGRRTSMVR